MVGELWDSGTRGVAYSHNQRFLNRRAVLQGPCRTEGVLARFLNRRRQQQ